MPQMHVGNCRFYIDPYCYDLTISFMVHTLFYANFPLNPIWTLCFNDFYEAMFVKCCSLVLSIVGLALPKLLVSACCYYLPMRATLSIHFIMVSAFVF